MAIKIFLDGANLSDMEMFAKDDRISGFTTNPTLMHRAGVKNYEAFCRGALEMVEGKPISFEVFADDFDGMVTQALMIDSWGENIYVKIPVVYTNGTLTTEVIETLSEQGVKLNITAVFTQQQVVSVGQAVHPLTDAIISIFAGRIADTGVNPATRMGYYVGILSILYPHVKVLWASPRQVLDIKEAERVGCDIITVTRSLLDKMALFGKDLDEYSQETVQMFYDDAKASGYRI